MTKIASEEAKRIIEHYLVCKDDLTYFDILKYGLSQKEAECLLNNWHQFDRPDIYSVSSEKIYGIEHFEYDAHGRHKRGSLQRKENNLIAKEMKQKAYGMLKDNDSCVISREMQSKANEDNYKNNFIYAFNTHYSKIDNYRIRLLERAGSNKIPVSMWFIAEDVTALGTHIIHRSKTGATYNLAWPLLFPEVEEIFKQSDKIDGIIFADNYYKKLTLIKRDKNAVDEFKKHNLYPNDKFLFFEPHTVLISEKIQ